MPSSTPERRARWWPEEDFTGIETATRYLEDRGYKLLRNWHWRPPAWDHEFIDEEEEAIIYLIEEWDYGGLMRIPTKKEPAQ